MDSIELEISNAEINSNMEGFGNIERRDNDSDTDDNKDQEVLGRDWVLGSKYPGVNQQRYTERFSGGNSERYRGWCSNSHVQQKRASNRSNHDNQFRFLVYAWRIETRIYSWMGCCHPERAGKSSGARSRWTHTYSFIPEDAAGTESRWVFKMKPHGRKNTRQWFNVFDKACCSRMFAPVCYISSHLVLQCLAATRRWNAQ